MHQDIENRDEGNRKQGRGQHASEDHRPERLLAGGACTPSGEQRHNRKRLQAASTAASCAGSCRLREAPSQIQRSESRFFTARAIISARPICAQKSAENLRLQNAFRVLSGCDARAAVLQTVIRSRTVVALEAAGFPLDTVWMYSIRKASKLARLALPRTRLPDRPTAVGGLS